MTWARGVYEHYCVLLGCADGREKLSCGIQSVPDVSGKGVLTVLAAWSDLGIWPLSPEFIDPFEANRSVSAIDKCEVHFVTSGATALVLVS